MTSADRLSYSSFTPRGIVALVFSCVAGVLGVIIVGWYGMSAPVEAAPTAVRQTIAEVDSANPSPSDTQSPTEEVVVSSTSGSGAGRA